MQNRRGIAFLALTLGLGVLSVALVVGVAGALQVYQQRMEARAAAAPKTTASPPAPFKLPVVNRPKAPEPKTTGRDFNQIWREIDAFERWLYANPDPDQLYRIYKPKCPCYQNTRKVLVDMNSQGWRMQVEPFKTQSLRVPPDQDFGDLVRINVVGQNGARKLLDMDLKVIETRPTQPPHKYTMVLILEYGRWYVDSFYDLGPA